MSREGKNVKKIEKYKKLGVNIGVKLKKGLSIILSLMLGLSIVGCAGTKGSSSMGRYVEEIIEGPADIEVQNLTLLEDGKIGLIGYSKVDWKMSSFISEDNGITWNQMPIDLPKEEGKDTYTNSVVFLSNGKILLSYYMQEIITEEMAEEMSKEEYVYEEPDFKYAIVETDGTFKDIELDLSVYNDDDEDVEQKGWGYYNFKGNRNGDVFFIAGSQNEKIVQFDGETMEEKNVYVGVEYMNDFYLVGDSLIVYNYDSIIEFDTNTGSEVGNLTELQEIAIGENVNYYPTFINSGSETKLYYYNTLGLYEYDMTTKEVKQVVDSAISSLGNSQMYLSSFIAKENGEFLTIFMDWSGSEGGSSLINFVYNPDIPSVPENKLVIYSLLENYQIRQSISSYAKAHPDTYVKYEIGLTYGDGQTQSDAIKALNTAIMAGNGPDIILLDGLSSESYVEKGLLEDLSDVINPLVEEGTIFKNISEAYKKDGKLYQMPLSFKYPILLGDKETIEKVSDLDSLVEVTKEFSTLTDKRIFENYYYSTPNSLVYSLYYLYGNDWLNEDNTINEEALTNFFTKVKEMYVALKENEENYNKYINDKYAALYGEEFLGKEEAYEEEYVEEYIEDDGSSQIFELQYYLNPTIYSSSFLFDRSSILALGGIGGTYYYGNMVTLLNSSAEIDYKVLTRGEEKIFTPANIIGINAKGKNKEEAKDLLTTLITARTQDMYYYSEGFSVNAELFEDAFSTKRIEEEGQQLEFNEEKNHYIHSTMGWGDQFGNMNEIDVLLPNDEDVSRLRSEIESLNVGTTLNTVLLTEVAKQFASYVKDEKTLDDAINEIVNNLDLYLSE